jgi:hypothetical protein
MLLTLDLTLFLRRPLRVHDGLGSAALAGFYPSSRYAQARQEIAGASPIPLPPAF